MTCFQASPSLYLAYLQQYTEYMFDFVLDKATKEILINAHQAVSLCNLWNYMEKNKESYMMSSDPETNQIYRKMEELGYTGHSGFSFGYAMRQMQYIAQHGMPAFKTNYLRAVKSKQ